MGLKEVQLHAKKMEKEVSEAEPDIAQAWLNELYSLLDAGQIELKTVVDSWGE